MRLISRSWVWGLMFAAAGLVVFSLMAVNGYPGVPDDCVNGGNCYCEAYTSPAVEPQGVKQPANSLSALVSIIVGAAILFWGDHARAPTENPLKTHAPYYVMYGFLVIFLGLGSLYFHGSLTLIGGFVDNLSMLCYITFLLLYNVYRIRREESQWVYFLVMLFLLNSILAIPVYMIDRLGTTLFTALVIVSVGMELWIQMARPSGIRRRFRWYVGALAVFALATLVWRLSWTGGMWCDPNSLLQGHALWHILSMAVAPALIFVYLSTETRPGFDDQAADSESA